MKDASTNVQELLQQIAEGKEYAFRELFGQYRQMVYGFAFAHVRSEALADEITQEVFVKIWTAGEKLGRIVAFDAWLRKVTLNLVYSYFRKVKHQREVLEAYAMRQEVARDTTAETVNMEEVERLLHKALQSLTEQQRTIFRMSREENMKYADIGTALGISVYNVNYHLKKIVAHLRSTLGDILYLLLPGLPLYFYIFL